MEGNGVGTNDHVLEIPEENTKEGNGVGTNDHVSGIHEGSGMEGNGVYTDDHVLFGCSMADKLNNVPCQNLEELCIHRVPPILRNGNEEAYTPQMVSIGPFHRGCKNLQAMERHKLLYFNDFLKRRPEMKLEQLIISLRRLENRARLCYGEPISLTSDKFIEMMLIDGCFIIEFFLKKHGYFIELFRKRGNIVREEITKRDTIISSILMRNIVQEEITNLLENQLPFFILEHLFTLVNTPPNISFLKLSLKFVSPMKLIDRSVDELSQSIHQVKHFVDLQRKCYIPTSERIPPSPGYKLRFIPSATELHASGVKFTKDKRHCFLNITFTKDDGVFNIPSIQIVDNTNRRFRNLIALEHFDADAQYISDYTTLMDCLISTADDVALLRRYEIIDNWLGDYQEVSLLFNKIGKGKITRSNTFYYAKLFEDVNIYYQKRRHKWRATLIRDYFGTPWSIVSFLAAFVLLVCTSLQTFYAVKKP